MEPASRSRRGDDRRQHPEQVVVPMTCAGRDGRVVILEESPDLAQHRQVLDLHGRQLVDDHTGAGIELVIEIERRLRAHRLRRLPDGLAIHQQPQVIRPHLAGAADQHAEEELLRVGIHGQRDRVLRPVVRAPDLARLHAGEPEVGRVAVLAHPQPHEIADRLAPQKAAPLDGLASEVRRDRLGERGERLRAGRRALEPGRPSPAMHDGAVDGDSSRRAAAPAGGNGSAVRRLEGERHLELLRRTGVLRVAENGQHRPHQGC